MARLVVAVSGGCVSGGCGLADMLSDGGDVSGSFEGAMVCLICPTATAAAVITGKLGGSAASLTTYTLLSNLLAAMAVPLVFPLVEPHADITFLQRS